MKEQALALIKAVGYSSLYGGDSLRDAMANLEYFVLHGADDSYVDDICKPKEEDEETNSEEAGRSEDTEIEDEEGHEEEPAFGGKSPQSQEEVARATHEGSAVILSKLEQLSLYELIGSIERLPLELHDLRFRLVRVRSSLTNDITKHLADRWFAQQEGRLQEVSSPRKRRKSSSRR